MSVGKVVTGAVWVWSGAAVLAPELTPRSGLGQFTFWMLALAHSIEALLYTRVAERADGSALGNLARIFLFGMFAVDDLRRNRRHPESMSKVAN